jgi:radical SAM protein with 4Fe4S-binding SPASM domain
MKSNIESLKDFVPLLRSYGIRRLAVQQVQLNRPGVEIGSEESIENVIGLRQKLRSLERHFVKHGIKISIPSINFKVKHKNCLWPWLETYITAVGDVTPCCRNNDNMHYICGNVFRDSFNSIWNNAKYRQFRRFLRENRLLGLCRDCTML